MNQTEHTAIVLRCADYRENDRMLTLFSPTKGRIEALSRGCRRPKSRLLAASQPFALGDFELYHKSDRATVTGITLTETFYPLRTDFDRLTAGTYLLNVCEIIIQPNQPAQELFLLLLHTLSRLTFTDQAWRPLLAGFLLHLSRIEGYQPELEHCICCGKALGQDEGRCFDLREGGIVCADCHEQAVLAERQLKTPPAIHQRIIDLQIPIAPQQWRWMNMALQNGSAFWVDSSELTAPLYLLRLFVEMRLDQPVRAAKMLPHEKTCFG